MHKILVIDVDRTLVIDKEALPTAKVREAIIRLQKNKNVHIVIATSRPFNQIGRICKYLDLSGFSIVSGGGQIVDVKTGEIVQEYRLDMEKIKEISLLVGDIVKTWVQDNGQDLTMDKEYKPNKPFVFVIHGLDKSLALQLLNKLSKIKGIFATLASPYGEGVIDINITDKYATKKQGIEFIAKYFGVDKPEIVGVGDSYNDLPFLDACGIKVAMGNAVSDVKNIADFIAPSVEENGLIEVIERYFFS